MKTSALGSCRLSSSVIMSARAPARSATSVLCKKEHSLQNNIKHVMLLYTIHWYTSALAQTANVKTSVRVILDRKVMNTIYYYSYYLQRKEYNISQVEVLSNKQTNRIWNISLIFNWMFPPLKYNHSNRFKCKTNKNTKRVSYPRTAKATFPSSWSWLSGGEQPSIGSITTSLVLVMQKLSFWNQSQSHITTGTEL